LLLHQSISVKQRAMAVLKLLPEAELDKYHEQMIKLHKLLVEQLHVHFDSLPDVENYGKVGHLRQLLATLSDIPVQGFTTSMNFDQATIQLVERLSTAHLGCDDTQSMCYLLVALGNLATICDTGHVQACHNCIVTLCKKTQTFVNEDQL
jgi:hypothetical protein